MHRCVQREAQEDPGGSGKAGGAKGMMYSVMYSGVASGVYDLWDGARDGHNDVIMDSLNSGVDVDDVTTLGKWTALQFAARSAKLESCQLLVEQGATVNKQNTAGGNSALHVVGDLACAKFLVSCGADIALQNTAGNTPLHRAAVSGHVEILEYLISLGADANLPNFSGNTPLHLATSTAVARALMAAGVDSSRKNNDRELPDQHAEKENRQAVAAAVRDYRELGFEMMSAKLAITAECDRAVMAARAAQVEAEDLTRGAVQQRDEEQAAKEEALAEVARLEQELRQVAR